MTQSRKGLLIFILVIIASFIIGSYILTATFFGVLTLIGLIAMIESIGWLKAIASRSTRTLDILIFLFTIFATTSYGLNIAASLTVAGIGYSLFYAPYLREERSKASKKREPIKNYSNNINWK